jgi:glycosyltransferase involved in cell wall biosynthesis
MKILYPLSIDGFFANAGQAIVERSLLESIVSRGIDVRIIGAGSDAALKRLSEFSRNIASAGTIEILSVDTAHAREQCKGVDAFLLHSLPLPGYWDWVMEALPHCTLPTIHYAHSFLLSNFEKYFWSELWRSWSGWPPARIIAPSTCTARRAESLAHEAALHNRIIPRVEIIPYGIFHDRIQNGSRKAGRKKLGMSKEELMILSFGRISPEKIEYRQLLFAFYLLISTRTFSSPVKLVIAGSIADHDQAYFSSLKKMAHHLRINSQVMFIENVDERVKADIFAAADVFISLAVNPQESFGVALLEALSVGIPIIATHWNGYPDALPPYLKEFMVQTVASNRIAQEIDWQCSSEACAPIFPQILASLERLLGDPHLRQDIGEREIGFARYFSWKNCAGRALNLIEHLCHNWRGNIREEQDNVAPCPSWVPCSMVDGLATFYLEDKTRIRLTRRPDSDGLGRGVRCLKELWAHNPGRAHGFSQWPFLREQRLKGLHKQCTSIMNFSGRREKVAFHKIYDLCKRGGEKGITAGELNCATGLSDYQSQWLILQFIRYGIADIVSS